MQGERSVSVRQKNELSASLFSGAMASPNKASKEQGLARF